MWLKAKHIKEAINIAANKIVEEVDIKSVVEEIKTDIAKNVLAKIEKQMWDNYGSFTNGQINHSLKSEMSRAKEKAANRIVYEIVEKKKNGRKTTRGNRRRMAYFFTSITQGGQGKKSRNPSTLTNWTVGNENQCESKSI